MLSDRKLEVGFFIDTYDSIDGVVVVMHNYIKYLKDRVNFFIVAPRGVTQGQKDVTNAEVLYCKGFHIPFINYDCALPFLDFKLYRHLMTRPIDIIHVHSPFIMGFFAEKIGKARDIPVIVTMHSQFKQDFMDLLGWLPTQILMYIIKKVYSRADEVWTVNENTKKLLLDDYKCTPKSVCIMCNATCHVPLKTDFRSEINQELGLKDDDRVLLFVGRLVPLKNVLLLPLVIKVLKDKNEEFKLIYVGDGPKRQNIEKMIVDLELQKNIIMLGRIIDISRLQKLYQRAELFVFPSYYDTDGIVKFEAAAQGTPTLFARDALASGGIVDGVNGFISDPDPEKYADKIIHIFSTPGLLQTVSKNVRSQLYRDWTHVTNEAYHRYLYLMEQKQDNLFPSNGEN